MYNTNRWCWLNRALYDTNVRGREDASLEEVGLGGFPLLRPIVYTQEYGVDLKTPIVETVVLHEKNLSKVRWFKGGTCGDLNQPPH